MVSSSMKEASENSEKALLTKIDYKMGVYFDRLGKKLNAQRVKNGLNLRKSIKKEK